MIVTYFGSPGVGKTTLAVKLAKKNLKHYKQCFLDFDHCIPGVYKCDFKGIGTWTFPDYSFIAINEAGIDFNNRSYKELPKPAIGWFKKHRHYKCDIGAFSQSWDDMDITLRRLSDQLWYMFKIGPWTLCRRVYKRVTVNKETEQIIDGYRMASMLWLLFWPLQYLPIFDKKFTLTFRPFYYKYFDSWDKDPLPVRPFPQCPPKRKRGKA